MAYLNNQNRWYILLVYTYIPFYEGDVKFIDPETATFFTRLSSEKISRYFVKRKLIFSALHIFLMVNSRFMPIAYRARKLVQVIGL